MTTNSIQHKRITQNNKTSKKNMKTERKHTSRKQSKLLFVPKNVTVRSNTYTISRCKFADSILHKNKLGNRTSLSIRSHYNDLRKKGIVVHNKRKRTIKYTPIPLFSQL
jgi:hypothetical protein